MQRCCNPNHHSYERYGGAGIRVTRRWRRFENFLEDMGPKPFKGANLDRVDGKKGYMKTNCRWVTPADNQNNKSSNHVVDWRGEQMTLSQWADRNNLDRGLVYNRRRRGWSLQKILNTPIDTTRRRRGL